MIVERGRPIPESRVDHAVRKAATAAGLERVSPHQLRHTLAIQAINRGMSIEAIAALLGHKSLRMTQVYARIADRTVARFNCRDIVRAQSRVCANNLVIRDHFLSSWSRRLLSCLS
jgi:site-specific recombinase XerD